jgi:outer membrane protein insertion porin family
MAWLVLCAAMLLHASATPVAAGAEPVPGMTPAIQATLGGATVCGLPVPPPSKDPPADSGPVVLAMLLCFEKQGGASMIEPETYLYYIQLKPSEPSRDRWIRYDAEAERVILGDFRRLWATNFLEDLVVDVRDYPLARGVVGKIIVFNMEERQRVKIVDYEGSHAVSQSDIDSRLKEKGVTVRLDSFLDPTIIRHVSALVRELYAEKGYQFASVTPVISEVQGGTKLVNLTFRIAEGPRVAIRDVEFVGNRHVSDDRLERVLKANRPQGLLSIANGSGTYKEDKFAEDAEHIESYYRDRGYISAQVGQPEIRPIDDSADGRTRWVQLRIPVTEGRQYVVGDVHFAGNKIVTAEGLQTLFKLKSGEVYSQQVITKGLEKAREVYGAAGHYEFTAYPDLKPRDQPAAGAAAGAPSDRRPVVDVTIRIDEGQQYLVNRISFVGNTQTRDEVVRRELALLESGVFNTEALKYSIRRINQLGYFKPLEGEAIKVDKTPGVDNKVDVVLKVEEQNRNQVSFGAGMSQYDGFFGNASFTTSNFLGRGESVTLALQKGARSSNYQLAFSEPFIFGRPITAGLSLYSRKIDYQIQSTSQTDYSEVRTGGSATLGWTVFRFTRLFGTYGYEVVDTASSKSLRTALGSNGSTLSSLLVLDDGRHLLSSFTPSLVFDTVDNPRTPRRGMRMTASYQYAGGILGGSQDFIKPELEAIYYHPVTRKTAFGLRATGGWITNYGGRELPYYLRYFMGGETQIRGVDIRSVGPRSDNGTAIGGTKFVLFNAEYYYDLMPAVRALLFHDAGQAFDDAHSVNLAQLRTSSGAELRVSLPVIGVPIRVIYAWNVYRDTFQPARAFRFAVGTTF